MRVFLRRVLLILKILLALVLLMGGVLAYNYWLNQTFGTTFYSVSTDKDIKDLRIVLLSDLHLSEFGENNTDLVRRIRNLSPDMIAVVGDMNMDDSSDYSIPLELMRQLVEIGPVYYSPGNHEWAAIYAYDCPDLGKDMEDVGVHWMNQTTEIVELNGNRVMIGGFFEYAIDELHWSGSRDVAAAMDGKTNDHSDVYTVLLCHCPELSYKALKDTQIDLILSGHAHGGLIRLPLTDGLYSTDQGILPKHTSGVNQLGSSTVVISRGLGDSEPYPRINNQYELVVIDIN